MDSLGLSPTLRSFLLLSLLATPLHGQTVDVGEIRGILWDSMGAPLAGAVVELSSSASGVTRAVESDRAGSFALLVPSGSYQLRVEQVGFRPLLVTGVEVRAGAEASIDLELAALRPGNAGVDTLAFAGLRPALRGYAHGRAITGEEWRNSAGPRHTFGDLAVLLGVAAEDLSTDALPSDGASMLVDGVPFAAAAHPQIGGSGQHPLMVPRSTLGSATLLVNGLDVAWAGDGGATWSVLSRAAPSRLRAESFGSVQQRTGQPEGGGDTRPAGLEAGLMLGGPVADSVSILFAVDAHLERTPALQHRADGDAATRVEAVARDAFGVSLAPEPPALTSTSLIALAGLDWQRTLHSLRVRARYSMRDARDEPHGLQWARGTFNGVGTDAAVTASLASELSRGWSSELHLGVTGSERSHPGTLLPTSSGSPDKAVPETWILNAGGIGAGPRLPGDVGRMGASLSESLLYRSARHRAKIGVAASITRHTFDLVPGGEGVFVFAGPAEFARQAGAFTQAVRGAGASAFSVAHLAGFIQERWAMLPGLELLVGLRAETEVRTRPQPDAQPDWFVQAGLTPTAPPRWEHRLLPRLGVAWQMSQRGRWTLDLGAGLYSDPFPPAVLNELYTELGNTRVRRGSGPFTRWPAAPDTLQAPFVGSRVSLADPDLASPRTLRSTIALSGSPWGGASLRLGLSYRWTDRLIRRVDLNLLPDPAGKDQHGRPLYGHLAQTGALLQASPGTNRRFDGFDRVSLLRSDGESRYLGASIALEQRSRWLHLFASHTYSEAIDNWPTDRVVGLERGASFGPSLADGGAWLRGRSDLDLPHRGVVGAEVRLPLPVPVRLAGVYRYRSGQPFTAGFQPGVDVNADGIAGNDPAFLDPGLAGYDQLASRWPCLREAGSYAARNACRTPWVSALDLRVSIPIRRGAELDLDLFNLLRDPEIVPDRALYLVDPTRTVTVDPRTGVSTVPFVINPNFGSPLLEEAAPRAVRLGINLRF